MERTPVSSSNIAAIGYSVEQQILEVEFKNRSIYQYFGIPASLYRGLMQADSHGSFLDTYIKKAHFTYRRVV